MEIVLALTAASAFLALLVASYTLLVHVRYPDMAKLRRDLEQLSIDLDTVRGSLEHQQRRNAARARRDGATSKVEGNGADLAHTPMTKEQLRHALALRRTP